MSRVVELAPDTRTPELGDLLVWGDRGWRLQSPQRAQDATHVWQRPRPRITTGDWQSPDFVSGSTGWRIRGEDGSAEFNNVTARGTIYAQAGEIEGVLNIGLSGGIYQGTGTFASPTTGLKIWNDSGVGRLATYKEAVAQVYLDSSGALRAGAGALGVDASGLHLDAWDTWFNTPSRIDWRYIGEETVCAGLAARRLQASGFHWRNVMLWVGPSDASNDPHIRMMAEYLVPPEPSEPEYSVVWTFPTRTTETAYYAFDNCSYGRIGGDWRVGGGVWVGNTTSDPDDNDVHYEGDLRPVRGGTSYTAYAFVRLTVPYGHPSFNTTAYSDVSTSTKIENTSWSTTIPAAAKALLLRMNARDSAALGTPNLYFALGPSSAYWWGLQVAPIGGNIWVSNMGVIPCTDGDVWYRIEASGAGTLDTQLECWGYFI